MANKCVIKLDAENKVVDISIRDETTGALAASTSQVEIDLADLTGTNKTATFREFHFKDANDSCIEKKCWILMTEPEAV